MSKKYHGEDTHENHLVAQNISHYAVDSYANYDASVGEKRSALYQKGIEKVRQWHKNYKAIQERRKRDDERIRLWEERMKKAALKKG